MRASKSVIAIIIVALFIGGIFGYFIVPSSTRVEQITVEKTVTVGAEHTKPSRSLDKFVMGVSASAPNFGDYLSHKVAIDIMRKLGYDIEVRFAGPTVNVQAYVAGKEQLLAATFPEVAPILAKGADVILVGSDFPLAYVFLARKDITDLRQMEGKKVAVDKPGALAWTICRWLAERLGLDLNKIAWIPLGGTPTRVDAVVAGRADLTVAFTDTSLAAVEKDPNLHIIATLDEAIAPLKPESEFLWVSRQFAQRYPQVLKDYLRSKITASAWAMQNRDEFLRGVITWVEGSYKPDKLAFYQKLYDLYDSKGFLQYVAVDPREIQVALEWSVTAGTLSEPIAVQKFYEPKYMNEVIAELGG